MNFFATQERSYRNTRLLLVLLTLAVIAVTASVALLLAVVFWLSSYQTTGASFGPWLLYNRELLLGCAGLTALAIALASAYRVMSLRRGGGRVARELGGTPVEPGDRDPLRQRLRNVVEEMAIASGIPVPEVFVLEHEAGINAFAAGLSPAEAAVAVTRGALEYLDRDELQGVIAHEFSHILNGDMRLNLRLMGPLFGILGVSLLGRTLLRSARFGRSRRGRAAPVILVLGAGLTIVGIVGIACARLIKAGVSRQREYLADASAVQFTRQTAGIAGALKKIGGLPAHSHISDQDAEEISHMLFASGRHQLRTWFATHPPLLQRIQRLDPAFRASDFQPPENQYDAADPPRPDSMDNALSDHAGFLHGPFDVASLLATVGNPDAAHVSRAQQIHRSVPAEIRTALESAYSTLRLLPALILSPDADVRRQQLNLLELQLGRAHRPHIEALYTCFASLPPGYRLPLLELAAPRLKQQPRDRVDFFIKLLERLAEADGRIAASEYAVLRLLQHYVEPHSPTMRRNSLEEPAVQAAASELLTVFAWLGHSNSAAAHEACERGFAALGVAPPAQPPQLPEPWIPVADQALAGLRACRPADQRIVVRSLLACALSDGQLNATEAELLQCFCNLLDCPLPPLIAPGNIE